MGRNKTHPNPPMIKNRNNWKNIKIWTVIHNFKKYFLILLTIGCPSIVVNLNYYKI